MVAQKYRWDFIGLSTDEKPMPATSEKVVNGSTFYCSDNSKLYVFCDGTWYERKPLGGGGGGGGSYIAGTGIDITDDTISVDTTTIQEKLTAGSNVTISDNTISATNTTYSAGTGLSLTGTEFSADTTVLATQNDLSSKQNTLTAGSNITISDNTISATDTTYSAFTGTDGTAAGTAGLVPAPATTDAGKFLKADGTWDTAGGGSGPTVVQTTGTSTTDVMSQNATTQMIFPVPGEKSRIMISSSLPSSVPSGSYYTAIGTTGVGGGSSYSGQVAIGTAANAASASNTLAIGNQAWANYRGSVAIGAFSRTRQRGEVNIGSTQTADGYLGNSNYRLLSGVYDGQSIHDAATVAQGNKLMTAAPATTDAGVLGQLWTDTTNMHTYQLTAIDDTTDPQNPVYTWTQRW